MIVFGIFGLIAAYSFKYTKETLHEDLPSTIEELSTENGDIMDDMNNSSFGFWILHYFKIVNLCYLPLFI